MTIVREIRESLGLSLSDFARLVGTSKQRVAGLEKSCRQIDVTFLWKLWRLSGWSAEKFLERLKL